MIQDYSIANQAIRHLRALLKVEWGNDGRCQDCWTTLRDLGYHPDTWRYEHAPDCNREAAQTWLDELDGKPQEAKIAL